MIPTPPPPPPSSPANFGLYWSDEEASTGSTQTMESPVTEKISTQVMDNSLELDNCISNGDYLELDDLADQESHESSSDNSSCLSTISDDDFFDSLLKELDDDPNNEDLNKHEKKGAGSTMDPNMGRQKAEYISEDASTSNPEVSFSYGQKSNTESKKKLKKKYLCFMSFII